MIPRNLTMISSELAVSSLYFTQIYPKKTYGYKIPDWFGFFFRENLHRK